MTTPDAGRTCPNCGAGHAPDAFFCEECAYDFTGGRATNELATDGGLHHEGAEPRGRQGQVATPVTAEQGAESPLDVGWTGAVSRDAGPRDAGPCDAGPLVAGASTVTGAPLVTGAPAATPTCTECGRGSYVDGYCDNCGSKQRDPRDHFTEEPQPWVAGVCDIGIRHGRNEDAMALLAEERQLSFAVLVVCDGVSNSTDSHIASLAASRAAREALDDAIPRGMGTRTAVVSAIEQRLEDAVQAARAAVVETTKDRQVESPPSCTFVAALIDDGIAVVGNVGDSRAYWLPDDLRSEARQLSRDDSFADEQIRAGVPREEAETSAGAHAITRWLGIDSPDDITPHTSVLDLDEDGWLAVVSDGLWNYCSEASDLRFLVHDTVARLGAAGHHPLTVAQTLTDFANERGGIDNITVALARVGQVDPAPPSAPAEPTAQPPTTQPPTTEPPTTELAAPGVAGSAAGTPSHTGEPPTAPGSSYRQEPGAPAPTASLPAPVDPVHRTEGTELPEGTDDGKDTP